MALIPFAPLTNTVSLWVYTMKSSYMASLLLFALSTLLPSVLAINDYLLPNHAVPEILIVPPNVTIMTPRDKKPQFERQLFDFGSPQGRVSELKRIAERQTTCPTGDISCLTDLGTCCPLGGMCCGGGRCCGSGRWCYGDKCCLLAQDGCDSQGCCDQGTQCCKGGACCPGGHNCVIIDGQLGCCPIGETCIAPPTCVTAGYSLCPNDTYCCPTGFICYRDILDNHQCMNPNPPTSTTYVPPTTTEEATSTYVPPPSVTRAQSTLTRSTATGAALSTSTTNVGATIGGAVAGVIAVIILIVILFIWRRRESQKPVAPTTAPITAPLDQPYGGTSAMPPTPGTGDPFLTPMTQNRSLGVSHLNDVNSGTNSASHYSGSPEPHHLDNPGGMAMGPVAVAEAAIVMPTPRHDSHSPRSLPMSVVHNNSNYASRNSTPGSVSPRPWSGFASGPPSTVANPGAYMAQPEHSGWSNHASSVNAGRLPYAEGVTSSGYAPDRQGQPETTSTMYQPSSHGGYDESLMARSPPPASPPPDMYGGMASSSADPGENGAGLPSSGLSRGTAPPTTYAPGEKQVYRPSQG